LVHQVVKVIQALQVKQVHTEPLDPQVLKVKQDPWEKLVHMEQVVLQALQVKQVHREIQDHTEPLDLQVPWEIQVP
jgi:hypothetical protein